MWVQPSQLVTYLREPAAGIDVDALEQALELTNELVDSVAGLSSTDPDPAGVRAIRLEVAARAYRNPNGYGGEAFGGYTAAKLPGERSGVYLTDQERADLLGAPAAAAAGSWAGSMPYRVR